VTQASSLCLFSINPCGPKGMPRRGLQDSAQGFKPGFNPGTDHPRATRPHKALLRWALEKNTRRARVGDAEGALDGVS
jgi:hypothetical protein